MAKDPAFLFYSADFMMGAMLLTMEERGQYITLLAIMHQQGRLSPDEVEVLIKKKPTAKLASKFKLDENGMWFNERLEEEAMKRKKFTESRKNSLDINNDDLVNVYILHDPVSNLFKIGSSKYPMLRLTDMQKKNQSIYLFWMTPILVKRSIEKDLHSEFKPKKVKNDWFRLSQEDIESILNKNEFRTDKESNHRTDSRTEDLNVDVNENIVFGIKKEWLISIRKIYANDKVKIIYDLPLYFASTGQLDSLKKSGMDKFEEFMKANPANVFDSEHHLYNSFRKYHVEGHLKKLAKTSKKKFTIEDLSQ